MTSIAEAASWMKAQRTQLGWSTQMLADRAREFARLAGYEAKLAQQTISAFENGTAKRMPRWFGFVQAAINAAKSEPVVSGSADGQVVQMGVLLPSAVALTEMFDSILLAFDEMPPRAELSRALALRLPTALARSQGLMTDRGLVAENVPAAAVPAPSRGHPVSRSQPRIEGGK